MMRDTNIRLRLPLFISWLLILTLFLVAGTEATIEGSAQPPPAVAEDAEPFYPYHRSGHPGQAAATGPDHTTPPRISTASLPWTYTAPDEIYYLDSWGDGLATGDLNGDAIPDLVFGTEGGYVIAVNGNNGAELWSYQITTQTDKPVNPDVVDVDDDGVLDLVATGMGDSTSGGRAIICALDNNGTVKWPACQYGDYEEAVDLAYGDIDDDGDTDIVASVGTYPRSGGQVILLDGATGTRLWSRYLGSGHPQGIDAQDVDNDGDMEIAVENYDKKVFLLDGATGTILWSRSKSWYGRDVIIEDVDDDGTYEIVSGGGRVTSYDPNGNQEWVAEPEAEGTNISASDLNGDGNTEVVFSSAFSGELHLLNGSTGETLWSRTRSGVHAVGDVDGDGVDDIVVATIRFYGIDPPYSVDAVDGSNNLLWSYPLDSIHNEGGFGLVTVNLDDEAAPEVVVANGTLLLALDPLDSDGDGLLDNWERDGIDANDDGTVDLDLPALGADPMHKDIFIEVDYMEHHRPNASAIQDVIDAFDDAPLSNPDGVEGIDLHVTIDEQLTHTNSILVWDEFDALKDAHFGTEAERNSANWNNIRDARRMVFRYALFIHQYNNSSSSGIAELPGNDFIVSLGAAGWGTDSTGHTVGSRDEQAGTFMHELGHTLGLRHGGGDNINCKPNYLSIMSYSRQTSYIIRNRPLDYSRSELPTLRENDLDENLGIQGPANWSTAYGPPRDTDGDGDLDYLTAAADGSIDWDGDGSIDSDRQANINDLDFSGCNEADATQTLTGYDDWENLLYNFRGTPEYADGIHLHVAEDEITSEIVEEIKEVAEPLYYIYLPLILRNY